MKLLQVNVVLTLGWRSFSFARGSIHPEVVGLLQREQIFCMFCIFCIFAYLACCACFDTDPQLEIFCVPLIEVYGLIKEEVRKNIFIGS